MTRWLRRDIARRVRKRDGATTAIGRDGCGSALAQSLGKSSGATPAEDLWHDAEAHWRVPDEALW